MFSVLSLFTSAGSSFTEWYIFLISLFRSVSTAIASDVTTNTVNNSECLGVLTELLESRVFVNATPLPLTAEELLQGILGDPLA